MPVEVIREILKRLLVKSLVRFRSVCKTWNSLICDPSFISTHLQASLSNNTPFLLRKCSTNRQKSYFLHYDNDGFDEFKQLQFPVSGGFVSDAVVLVPFVNGALHWLGYQKRNNDEYSNVILGFDLSAEEFFEISLSESLSGLHYMDLSSTKKYGESSIAVLRRESGYTELFEWWVMKEYGVFESWTKLLTLDFEYIPRNWFPRVLGFRKNRQVLLHVANGRMASLDLNSQQMELHGVEGVEVVTGRIYLEGTYGAMPDRWAIEAYVCLFIMEQSFHMARLRLAMLAGLEKPVVTCVDKS
ncbi:hypothetical protein V6N11_017826 [Hibiscus sabdariffa]|uniref:F-box domain-containing protein n=1 Tax=Hibiscus sabdariffa TaxID=183260 RepID=A0ABR2T6J5_9ROSI